MQTDSNVLLEPRKARKEHYYLSNMLKLIDASSDSATTEEAYESTMSQLVELTGLRGMALVLRANDSYALVSSNGLSDSLSANIHKYPGEFSGIFRKIEDAEEPIPFYDANNDKFFPARFRHKMEYVDVVYVPIRHAGVLLGFLCMGKEEPGEWSPDDLAIFATIGKLSGIIIYRAIVTEKQRLEAVERERARTEARLRDSIIQALGISVIEEQMNREQNAPASKQGSTLDLIEQQLTQREKDILREVATGASNQEIARHLFISTGTVKMTLQNIMRKLNVRNRVEAAVYAVEAGLGRDA